MRRRRLSDAYRFPGFIPKEAVGGIFGEPGSRIVHLERAGKKLSADPADLSVAASTITRPAAFATYLVATLEFISSSKSAVYSVKSAEK